MIYSGSNSFESEQNYNDFELAHSHDMNESYELVQEESRSEEKVFVVMLNNGQKIAVKESWIENPNLKSCRIFYSPNVTDKPIFDDPKHYFKIDKVGCYIGQIHRSFGRVFLNKDKIIKKLLNFRFVWCSKQFFEKNITFEKTTNKFTNYNREYWIVDWQRK